MTGGRSAEREISLVSGRAILRALSGRGAASESGGPARCVEVAIETDGSWRVDGERCDPPVAIAMLPRETLYFLGLHGGEGANGAVQGLFETASRRYTGSGVGASALCMGQARDAARREGGGARDRRGDAHRSARMAHRARARAPARRCSRTRDGP